MTLKPEFRLHWVQEFEPDPDAEGYKFTESTQTLCSVAVTGKI